MKRSYLWFTSLLILFFALVVAAQKAFERPPTLVEFKSQFFASIDENLQPKKQVNILGIVRDKKSEDLLDLSLGIPHYHLFPSSLRTVLDSNFCGGGLLVSAKDRVLLDKIIQWRKFECGLGKIDDKFFLKEPFIHPNGKSFAKLALERGISLTRDQYASMTTLTETLAEGDVIDIELSQDLDTTEALQQRNFYADSENFVFLKSEKLETELSNYNVYSRLAWNEFTKDHPYIMIEGESNACLENFSGGCWAKSSRVDENYQRRIRWILLGIIGIFSVLVGAIVSRYLYLKQVQDRKQKFVFQMLTHELRTPVASIVLLIEKLRDRFENFKTEEQKTILDLFTEVQRLKRTTESSQKYLQVSGRNRQSKSEESFDLAKVIDELQVRTQLQIDKGLASWHCQGNADDLLFCLENLVQNAISHGKPPFVVAVTKSSERVEIVVEDQGTLETKKLKDLIESEKRFSQSKGLGIGLSLIQEVCRKNKWHLSLTKKPTRFMISLRITEVAVAKDGKT